MVSTPEMVPEDSGSNPDPATKLGPVLVLIALMGVTVNRGVGRLHKCPKNRS